QLVYVANLITQDGETMSMSLVDHIHALMSFTGLKPDFLALVNKRDIDVPPPFQVLRPSADMPVSFVEAELKDDHFDWPQHDPMLLGQALSDIWEGR
ncbi:MAG: hypothetical protein KJN81_08535, partial [Acidimicrobiia bacterium]|nr:hypothetical protein [Acidimicrobiia bacterium]NNL28460.1 hypothetical protein [Acidimicrobiia bacterium]